MKLLFLFLLIGSFTFAFADSACGEWAPFKDEKCLQIISEMHTFDEAVKVCQAKEPGATLISIGSLEEQQFMADFLYNKHKVKDEVWLGARYVNSGGKSSFRWSDDTEVKYTNWAAGSPHNSSTTGCVQLRHDLAGKWTDDSCDRHLLVACQKPQTWSIAKLQQTLLDSRKESREREKFLENEIQNLKNNPVPKGFIYVQLPSQPEPGQIWPQVKWAQVTSDYAGVFFRAEGNGAAVFGQTQPENAPRLVEVLGTNDFNPYAFPNRHLDLKLGQWSEQIYSGAISTGNSDGIKFKVSDGEVRPKNMAVRIWKRIE